MVAVVGALLPPRARPLPHRQRVRWIRIALAGTLVAFALAVPEVGVFGLLVAANLVLGPGEWVPFSSYPMFSLPAESAWSLVVEDEGGNVVPVGTLGLDPVAAKKRFATEEQAALDGGAPDRSAARRIAAAAYASTLDQHRPVRGPLASTSFTVCLIEYTLVDGRTRRARTELLETTPS